MAIVCGDKKTIKLGRKYMFDGLGMSGTAEGKKLETDLRTGAFSSYGSSR